MSGIRRTQWELRKAHKIVLRISECKETAEIAVFLHIKWGEGVRTGFV
jgi:hypothetical protein